MRRRALSLLGEIFPAAVDVLFPSHCVACGAVVPYSAHLLCACCRGRIEPVRDRCPRCSGILAGDGCTLCGNRRFYPSRHIAVAEYEGSLEKALHALKFMGRRRLHRPLAGLLHAALAETASGVEIVTAVPMNRDKKWKRGFNQSELMARLLARRLGRPYIALLAENPRSATQRKLHSRDRYLNVLGRYSVINPAATSGKRVLLVDDVLTTGATINECARMLISCGAADVISVTVARAGIKKLENI
ncbi:MAG TPA: ComF family protein [Spirochaetota bacterium]|nr:ComF family protein [Spirochaetota bacterium]